MAKEPHVYTAAEVKATGKLQEKYAMTVQLNHLREVLSELTGTEKPCISILYYWGFDSLEKEIELIAEEIQLIKELTS
jgi:hypothetical protein